MTINPRAPIAKTSAGPVGAIVGVGVAVAATAVVGVGVAVAAAPSTVIVAVQFAVSEEAPSLSIITAVAVKVPPVV